MINGTTEFLHALTEFERAVAGGDTAATAVAHRALTRAFAGASAFELTRGGPRLAVLLDDVPFDLRADTAVLIAGCVHRGARALDCWSPVLRLLAETLADAAIFAQTWRDLWRERLPDPQGEPRRDLAHICGADATTAWFALDRWVRAGLALLQHAEVRRAAGPRLRATLSELHSELADTANRWYKPLAFVLAVLDDEPLVILHRPTRTGYRLRLHGIGDNFQLHTLLADALIGGGHLPGEPPSAEAVAVCRTTPGTADTHGSFDFSGPDGGRIRDDGIPSDIPVLEGERLLVLDSPRHPRRWRAGRYFPCMPGDLALERALSAEEVTARFEGIR
ncbi:hypothetical protein NDR87_01345 [Nocardia sp. CDC159]|uniref:Uncharacterized protein n=1 Tax=Nocardia pulmonis TaxID=2951408 RepID=A0A9X2IW10_9NOCA|nr:MULTISPECIES: hypothetical protein [Nocardia]MCM6772345.1 hypothetical protein [Nocardia pulmonis]MCM6784997.1 hypothetical protein [Nocardia sp. CDC159]